jgi:hypothetical protein
MKLVFQLLPALALFATATPAPAAAPDPLCAPLRAFVDAVPPDEDHALTFHTIWGSNFKDSPDAAISAKRCDHAGYAPAKAACAALLQEGAIEFAGNNVSRALTCLSPDNPFAPTFAIERGRFHFVRGGKGRGHVVTIDFADDAALGGMALTLEASGY